MCYLKMTMALYLCVPFLKEIASREESLKLFIILSFIFTFALPNSIDLISSYSETLSEILRIINSNFSVNFYKGPVFYFMFGYYLNKICKITNSKKYIIYFFGIIGLLFTTKILYYISINHIYSPEVK